MVFSSPIFIFGFLPIALLVYYACPRAWKNITLLLISLFFYAWGEVFYLTVMLVSIFANFIIGKLIGASFAGSSLIKAPRLYLALGLVVNIGILVSFKYVNFITDNINVVLSLLQCPSVDLAPIHLPLGISFFTFQAISYIVDVYRKEVRAQDNLFNLALYISLFPQLIAGPIVRYHDIAEQILARSHSVELFASGVRRFVYGLAKKMLIANTLGEVADHAFSLQSQEITMPLAWIGVLAYSLQIYFDFSGYSDMAIGLGRMFGFRFRENFNYPYVSRSMREFWRRWHISLSSWFRDYVYISLGGNRVSQFRVYNNLLIVFVLTGIWHGASWNFLVWGLCHGFFLALEHAGLSGLLKKAWLPVQHMYLLLVVLVSWVFFRADSLTGAVKYLVRMGDISAWQTTEFQFVQVLSPESIYVFALGILLATPFRSWVSNFAAEISVNSNLKTGIFVFTPRIVTLSLLLYLSVLKVASSTYNPFIYFRF